MSNLTRSNYEQRKTGVGLLAAMLLSGIAVAFSWMIYSSFRIDVGSGEIAILTHKVGSDLTNGQEQRLSDTVKDESPSFSPNGKYIMYATGSGRRGSLAVVSVDGRVKQRLTMQAGDIREPTWGPFMK